MGSCVNAPMIAVADYRNGAEGFTYTYYEDLTAKSVVAIMDELKSSKQPRVRLCVHAHTRNTVPRLQYVWLAPACDTHRVGYSFRQRELAAWHHGSSNSCGTSR